MILVNAGDFGATIGVAVDSHGVCAVEVQG